MKKCGLALVALSALTGIVVQADDALPSKVYVGPNGSNKFPYATPDTAAHDLTEAFAAVQATEENPGEIVVADGTYQCPDIWYVVDRPIYLHSENGPATTFLQGWRSGSASSNYRVLKVDHEKALVSGFTIEKGWGGRLYIALDELPGRETAATANWELCLLCVPFVLVADNMLEYAA